MPAGRSLWGRLRKAILLLLLLPYALAIFYLVIPPPSTLMLGRWLTLQKVERNWVPLNKISPNLITAVVAAEDGSFCGHFGFDFEQMEKSIEKSKYSKKAPRGASTISQQTAKNLFLWNERSWIRKVLEVPLTGWLEVVWPKRRILEVYLNIAEWGDGIYGADAAARHYFGIPASSLSPRQSALLAAALPAPTRRPASRPTSGQLMQAGVIERRAAANRPDLSCLR